MVNEAIVQWVFLSAPLFPRSRNNRSAFSTKTVVNVGVGRDGDSLAVLSGPDTLPNCLVGVRGGLDSVGSLSV